MENIVFVEQNIVLYVIKVMYTAYACVQNSIGKMLLRQRSRRLTKNSLVHP